MSEASSMNEWKQKANGSYARAVAMVKSRLQDMRALPQAKKAKILLSFIAVAVLGAGMLFRDKSPVGAGPSVQTSSLHPTSEQTRNAARTYATAKAEESQGSYRAAAEAYAEAARKGNAKALKKLVAMSHAKKCEVRSEAADALATVHSKKARVALKKMKVARYKDEPKQPGLFSCSSRRAAQKALEKQTRG